jgi:hypothetical protein
MLCSQVDVVGDVLAEWPANRVKPKRTPSMPERSSSRGKPRRNERVGEPSGRRRDGRRTSPYGKRGSAAASCERSEARIRPVVKQGFRLGPYLLRQARVEVEIGQWRSGVSGR